MKRKELEELQLELKAKRKAIDNVVESMEEHLLHDYQILTAESERIKKVCIYIHTYI